MREIALFLHAITQIIIQTSMKKTYQTPYSTVYAYMTETMLATSPGLKDELGGDDQLSNDRSGWDTPEWATDED